MTLPQWDLWREREKHLNTREYTNLTNRKMHLSHIPQCSEWCTVGYGTGARDLWIWSIVVRYRRFFFFCKMAFGQKKKHIWNHKSLRKPVIIMSDFVTHQIGVKTIPIPVSLLFKLFAFINDTYICLNYIVPSLLSHKPLYCWYFL